MTGRRPAQGDRRHADRVTTPVAADPDSRARTHLANERTFLAWFRTGFTLTALGLVVAQLLERDREAALPLVHILASVAVVTGVVLVVVGSTRYRTGRARIDEVGFRPAGTSVLIATVAAVVFAVFALVFIWTLR